MKSHRKGLNYEQEYGIERANEIKEKISLILKNKYENGNMQSCRKGLNYEQEYGEEKAKEIKDKMRLSHLGKIVSEETKLKLKGENNPMFGKNHTKETIEKMSKSKRGKPSGNRRFINKDNIFSKIMDNEIIFCECGCGGTLYKYVGFKNRKRRFIRNHDKSDMLKKWNIQNKGTPKYFEMNKKRVETRKRLFKEGKIKIKVKDTQIELKIQQFLKLLGIEFFTHQYIQEIEHGYQCDILIPSMNLVIECDGDYWHGNILKYKILNEWQLKQVEEDKIRTKELIDKGFRIIRLWENEINQMNLEQFREKIK